MKVVVFQGGAVGGEPSREELLNLWYGELDGYPGIDEVVYRDKLELEKLMNRLVMQMLFIMHCKQVKYMQLDWMLLQGNRLQRDVNSWIAEIQK